VHKRKLFLAEPNVPVTRRFFRTLPTFARYRRVPRCPNSGPRPGHRYVRPPSHLGGIRRPAGGGCRAVSSADVTRNRNEIGTCVAAKTCP